MLPTETPLNNTAHYRQNDETPGNSGDESPVMALHHEATSLVRTAAQRRPAGVSAIDFAIAVTDDTIARYTASGHLAEAAHVQQVREQLHARKRHDDAYGQHGPYVDGLPSIPFDIPELPADLDALDLVDDLPDVEDDIPPHTDAAPARTLAQYRAVYASLSGVEKTILNVGVFLLGCFGIGFTAAVSDFIGGLVF